MPSKMRFVWEMFFSSELKFWKYNTMGGTKHAKGTAPKQVALSGGDFTPDLHVAEQYVGKLSRQRKMLGNRDAVFL
jgi:hypothetical protein